MKKQHALAIFILFIIYFNAHAMEISVIGAGANPIGDKYYFLFLKGDIQTGDYKKIMNVIRNEKTFPADVSITSHGGEVVEAIKIGRFIRKASLKVGAVRFCDSACVFILAAGVERHVNAMIGLHRPSYNQKYFAGLSAPDAEKKYRELDIFVRTYLIDMNVPTNLIDRMMSTKSSDVDTVAPNIFEVMIGKHAPAYQEWVIAKCGELSKSEERDLQATNYLALPESVRKKHSIKDTVFSEEGAQYAKTLSSGYRDYLLKKYRNIYQCTKKSLADVRNKLILGTK